MAECDAEAYDEGHRALLQAVLDRLIGSARPAVVALQEVVAGQERFDTGTLGADGLGLLEGDTRLLGLVIAGIDLPEDDMNETLPGIVLGQRLQRFDRLLEIYALVDARVIHALYEPPLAVGGIHG